MKVMVFACECVWVRLSLSLVVVILVLIVGVGQFATRHITTNTVSEPYPGQGEQKCEVDRFLWQSDTSIREAFFGSRQLKVAEMGGRAPKNVKPQGSAAPER